MASPPRANGKAAWKRRQPRSCRTNRLRRARRRAFISRRLLSTIPPRSSPNCRRCSAAADVAAVLLRLNETDQRTMISRVKALAPVVQNAGAALLIDGHPEIVARGGADGAHLADIAALEEALPSLKPDRIAGVGGLTTRHHSMAAGELGADYVLFGEPDAKGSDPRSRPSPSGWTGGPNCSSRPPSALPPRARRLRIRRRRRRFRAGR